MALFVLIAVALTAVVTMAVIFALSDPDASPAPDTEATPTQAAQPSVRPSTGASASAGDPETSAIPPVVGGSAAEPGLTVVAAVGTGDTIEVTESVYWPAGGPNQIVLEVPDLSETGGVPTGVELEFQALQISIDGTAVVPVPAGSGDSWTVTSPSGAPSRMEIRYLVDGALVRSTPSQAGRAIVVIAPLSEGVVQGLPVTVSVAGQGVLSLACAGPTAAPSLCGRLVGDRWTATLPAGSQAVVAQLDLSPVG